MPETNVKTENMSNEKNNVSDLSVSFDETKRKEKEKNI
jgi:hypothetical protein